MSSATLVTSIPCCMKKTPLSSHSFGGTSMTAWRDTKPRSRSRGYRRSPACATCRVAEEQQCCCPGRKPLGVMPSFAGEETKTPLSLHVIAEHWRECPRRLRSAEKLSVKAESSKRKVELLALCELEQSAMKLCRSSMQSRSTRDNVRATSSRC